MSWLLKLEFQLLPYEDESTASRPICKVKHLTAQSVLRWGTTWEYCGVAISFCFLLECLCGWMHLYSRDPTSLVWSRPGQGKVANSSFHLFCFTWIASRAAVLCWCNFLTVGTYYQRAVMYNLSQFRWGLPKSIWSFRNSHGALRDKAIGL